ncbi:nuclear transport factor 2 family protein [Actinoplanes sp. NPDC051411]|uniref:nuclear transport factor 2 family protein n=1 Tax=Actinoplanes sp. NPDC051411 TaxID=3155522 RepID=UPI003433B83F
MPWLPDFQNAAELARRQTHAAGHADPVGQYIVALTGGDPHAIEDAWPERVVVFDPRAGEVRGHHDLRDFVHRSRDLLAQFQAHLDAARKRIVVPGRAVVELLGHVTFDGTQRPWPVAIVAESHDDSVVFRSYFSRRPTEGQRFPRPSILPGGAAVPGGVVGWHLEALAAGDVEAVLATFGPGAYLRETDERTHRGGAELRAYLSRVGSVELQPCVVTDDGSACVVEFNCLRLGGREMSPQAGLVAYERGADGLLAAVRIYGDLA